MNGIFSRVLVFQRQLVTMWRAFLHPATPLYLKAIMVGLAIYLISPFDLLPDFFLGLGMIDDVLLIAFAATWIINRLPPEVLGEPAKARRPVNPDNNEDQNGPTIDGTSRRL